MEYSIITDYMRIFIDNVYITDVTSQAIQSLAVNRYVTTISVSYKHPHDSYKGTINYLKIYGTYIQ